MNVTITLPDGSTRTASMVPGSFQRSDRPEDTALVYTENYRAAAAETGFFSVYITQSFTVQDALTVALAEGQGRVSFSSPVSVDHAVVSVFLHGDSRQARLSFSGTGSV